MKTGFVQVSFSAVRDHGALVLLGLGMAIWLGMVGMGLATGWTPGYLPSAIILPACILPAAGVAWMYLDAAAAADRTEGEDA